jgi:hypothetical protein
MQKIFQLMQKIFRIIENIQGITDVVDIIVRQSGPQGTEG